MAKELKTSWICIATSGPVVHGNEDGRFIKKEWLTQMVETFDLKVYTPMIYPNHERYYEPGFGKVVSLKTEEVTEGELKGEIKLFAILCPNDSLIAANKSGAYRFPSIEVGENFRKTGKYFLKAIGVTNEPASAGVTELKFSKKKLATIVQGEEFNVNDHLQPEEKSRVATLMNSIFGKSQPEESEETEAMNKQQFEELKNSIAQLSTSFSTLSKKLGNQESDESQETSDDATAPSMEEFKKLQKEFNSLKQKVDGENEEENKDSSNYAKQIADLSEQMSSLNTAFKAALKEVPGSDSNQEDETGDTEEVF